MLHAVDPILTCASSVVHTDEARIFQRKRLIWAQNPKFFLASRRMSQGQRKKFKTCFHCGASYCNAISENDSVGPWLDRATRAFLRYTQHQQTIHVRAHTTVLAAEGPHERARATPSPAREACRLHHGADAGRLFPCSPFPEHRRPARRWGRPGSRAGSHPRLSSRSALSLTHHMPAPHAPPPTIQRLEEFSDRTERERANTCSSASRPRS